MTRKQIISSIGFVLASCVVLYLLCDLFELKNTTNFAKRFATYRDLKEDTVDVVMVGTSGIDRYWINAKAYEEYGITSYPLSTGNQPAWLCEYLIKEAYAYQDPELLVIDMRGFLQDNVSDVEMDVNARRVLDVMGPLSVQRVQAGLKTMDVLHDTFEDKPAFNIEYLLSFVKFHEDWSNRSYSVEKNLFDRQHPYLGFYVNKDNSIRKRPREKVVYDSNHYEALDPLAEQAFYDVVECLKDKDSKVLFMISPKFLTPLEMGRLNTLIDLVEKEGMDYVNFCETDENGDFLYDFGFDLQSDFYDIGHTNYYGAEKFSSVFGAYLNENYDLPDRRNDADVKERWDGVYDEIKNRIPELEEAALKKKLEAEAAGEEVVEDEVEDNGDDEDEGEDD